MVAAVAELGFESQRKRRFHHGVPTGSGDHQASYAMSNENLFSPGLGTAAKEWIWPLTFIRYYGSEWLKLRLHPSNAFLDWCLIKERKSFTCFVEILQYRINPGYCQVDVEGEGRNRQCPNTSISCLRGRRCDSIFRTIYCARNFSHISLPTKVNSGM
jgi:hypothetical protein